MTKQTSNSGIASILRDIECAVVDVDREQDEVTVAELLVELRQWRQTSAARRRTATGALRSIAGKHVRIVDIYIAAVTYGVAATNCKLTWKVSALCRRMAKLAK